MPSDLEISRAAKIVSIDELIRARGLDILPEEIEVYGRVKAKVSLSILGRLSDVRNGRYIDVTAVTPTPLGEGKTVTTVGLSQALHHIGKRVFTCVRQPSMGPTFGIKGGAAGGGYAQVVPMEEFNLHLTGDFHAVSIAHNLLAAAIDSSIYHRNPLEIDPATITWSRVVDVNDRALRQIVIGLGGRGNGVPREASFEITAASEIMAILALARDLADLRARLGRVVVARNRQGAAVTAEDIGAAGAMAVLLKDAIRPTLMQTLEGSPVFVHCGPFANIAHGNSSIVADRIALKLADYVVTESGFGADMGMEKFMDIKCRVSGLRPNCVVMVASVRALKMHGSEGRIAPGRPLPPELTSEDIPAVERGLPNLQKQVENARLFGVPVVVAVNRFPTDTDGEVGAVLKHSIWFGAESAHVSNVWAEGGRGAVGLAEAVIAACEMKSAFRFLYTDVASIEDKIETIATQVYGADGVDYDAKARGQIQEYTRLGFGRFPICMAKTQLSLSHDPKLRCRPTGWRLPIREVRLSAGAGFLYPLCGEMRTMPGLPSRPALTGVDIDVDTGEVQGLF